MLLNPKKLQFYFSERADLKIMSQKQVKRTIEWTIENFTRNLIEEIGFEQNSSSFILKLGDNITEW
jgi:hypothetical protein